jgi:phage baseplate assembly protein W
VLGFDRTTFQPLDGWDHVVQSIHDILLTPVGSRVSPWIVTAANGERLSIREYGSRLLRHIDKPLNDATLTDIVQDVAEALDRWEPRVRVEIVRPVEASPGLLVIELVVTWLEVEEQRSLTINARNSETVA